MVWIVVSDEEYWSVSAAGISGVAGYTRECAYAVVVMSMVGNFV
jgi:hypothetical protein